MVERCCAVSELGFQSVSMHDIAVMPRCLPEGSVSPSTIACVQKRHKFRPNLGQLVTVATYMCRATLMSVLVLGQRSKVECLSCMSVQQASLLAYQHASHLVLEGP